MLHTLSIDMTCNKDQVQARGPTDVILLAMPSGLQTNPLSVSDRKEETRQHFGPESPLQTLLKITENMTKMLLRALTDYRAAPADVSSVLES